VRQKLNPIGVEFKGKNVLIVDDSIVRGTTSNQIVQMARESGANRVVFASAAPPVRYPNVYGIDMPTRDELIAFNRDDEQIRESIGADQLVYQSIEDMKQSVRDVAPHITSFEASCFDGVYITGDVTTDYLDHIEFKRHALQESAGESRSQLNLNLDSD
jgi:amidophosphoribosyltransferase